MHSDTILTISLAVDLHEYIMLRFGFGHCKAIAKGTAVALGLFERQFVSVWWLVVIQAISLQAAYDGERGEMGEKCT